VNGWKKRTNRFQGQNCPPCVCPEICTSNPALAAAAAQRALQDAGCAPADIDAVLISTCTGYLCPGLTSYVSERLGLDREALQAHEKVISLGKGQAQNYFRLGFLYLKNNQPDIAISAFAKAIELEPDRYRQVLKEELKKVHSVLDPIRYTDGFTKLLREPVPAPN